MTVSIHAPVQGATFRPHFLQGIEEVSIHAPVQGATRAKPNCLSCGRFRSTPPCRGRRRISKPDQMQS